MSVYRQSPSKSPYKSIVRNILDDRYLIEDQIALKKNIAIESEHRRLLDEVSILRLKLRKTQQLEIKHDSLLRQLTGLTTQRDMFAVENDRLKLTFAQIQDRTAQISEQNSILKLQSEALHRDKVQNTKLYENHITKLQILLEEKIKQLDIFEARINKLLAEKETNSIRYQQDIARLKSQITRTEYARQREAEMDKEKMYTQKLAEIDIMKRNHISQIALLDDQVKKLARLSELKSAELDIQINQNRQLKAAQEIDTKQLLEQNQALRLRISKLEELNRSQIESIEVKYSNLQAQGTISLKEQHGNQIRLLLSQLEKQKWLIGQKNIEIQQLLQQKRQLRQSSEDQQLELNSEINLYKSKLLAQQDKYIEDKNNQAAKINALEQKLLRESESYHERVRNFTNKIQQLQGQIRNKEVAYEKVRKQADLQRQKLLKQKEDLRQELTNIKLNLNDNSDELEELKAKSQDYRKKTQQEYQKLARRIGQLDQQKQTLKDQIEALRQDQANQRELLKQQNQSLKRTNSKLQTQLKDLQTKFTSQLGQLSQAHADEIKRLQAILSLKLSQITKSFNQQKSDFETQLQFAKKYASDKEQQLRNLLQKFEQLNVNFNNREKLIQFVPKSDASILQSFNQQRHQSQFRVFDK